MEPEEIVQVFFPRSQDELVVGEVPVSQLAESYGTPFYVYDAAILRQRFHEVRAALGDRVRVLYALKANPCAAVVDVLVKEGAGLDVASRGEIFVAKAVGVKGSDVHFAGPGKAVADIDAALDLGIGAISLESAQEMEQVSQRARRRGITAGVSIRIHPDQALAGSRMRMGGRAEKFGVLPDEAEEMIRYISKDLALELQGLHIYAGTQCFDAAAWVENARYILGIASRFEAATGVPIRKINFGGGFGVPLFAGESPFDLAAAGTGMQELLAEDNRPDRSYYVELGRYLTAPAGAFVSRVIYAKQVKDTSHLILDGGMNHHAAAAGFGSIIKRSFPMVAAEKLQEAERMPFAIGGNLCTPADEFCAQQSLPPMKGGALLAILMSGAYGLTFSNTMFLGHPTPAEILVDGSASYVVREAGTPADAMRGQSIPGRQEGTMAEVA